MDALVISSSTRLSTRPPLLLLRSDLTSPSALFVLLPFSFFSSLPSRSPSTAHIPVIGVDVRFLSSTLLFPSSFEPHSRSPSPLPFSHPTQIWEHAFYLQYKNVKPDYLKAVWEVVNWEEAESRFNAATK